VTEVYDDPQPPMRIEVASIEAFAPRNGIVLAEVRPLDSGEDRVDVRRHPRASPCKMLERARIDCDAAPVRIRRPIQAHYGTDPIANWTAAAQATRSSVRRPTAGSQRLTPRTTDGVGAVW
jgi:hypothetical protein